jgi:hypothetical protein
MRDYIFSLTLLSIFLGGYTALVVQFAKPIDPGRAAASLRAEQTGGRVGGPFSEATPRQVAEPVSED